MTLVAGVDSSTQACKVVVVDADTGEVVREGRAAHPDALEADPADWEAALSQAAAAAGGLDDVAAVSVAAQQHGLVALDERGEVIRPALLWNDVRAAGAAEELIAEAGGPQAWAEAVGSVPVSSFTISKLRWLARHEPENAARIASVCLPHDWLTWRLSGSSDPATITTDRGDASGTGYWSPASGQWRPDLVSLALGREVALPTVLGPLDSPGRTPSGAVLGAGTGDNAGAMLGVDAQPGEVLVSIGTSGVACMRADAPAADATGIVAGFASASGDYLPLVCTLNAARVLQAVATVLGVDQSRFDELALDAPPGADGLVLVPYLEGERTPNLPDARGSLHGMSLATCTPSHLARAAVEGMLTGLADAVDALPAEVDTVLLVGGGTRSRAVREIAPTIFETRVVVPAAAEYVALGAARQAALALHGDAQLPAWSRRGAEERPAAPLPAIRQRYATYAALAGR